MKKIVVFLIISILAFSTLAGCGNSENVSPTDAPSSTPTVEPSPTETPTPTPTETPTPESHSHSYTESITKEATCVEAGEKTFTCACGDVYTEQIEATGHNYEIVTGSEAAATCTTDGKKADKVCDCGDKVEGEVVKATGHNYSDYKSDNNATYDADGTKTATCTTCGAKDTVTDKGSKLERPKEPNMYGIEFENATRKVPQYCLENTDVYFEPSFQGPVIGHLNINDEVKMTGYSTNDNAGGNYPPYDKTEKPTEVEWIRINYNGQTGYIPYKYVWKSQRDTSITLNPLAANYPTVDGGGSGLFYPYKKEWRYVYGACGNFGNTIALAPNRSSVEIYDGPNKNVIATITDHSLKFELTGNAYCTYRDDVGSYYIYEIYYNGSIAYMDSLMAIRQ